MLLEKSLKELKVAVKSGGNLVTRRAVLSLDEETKFVFIITSEGLLTYSTVTGQLIRKWSPTSTASIVNVIPLEEPEDSILVFLSNGELIHVDSSDEVISSKKVPQEIEYWVPITHFIDIVWPTRTATADIFFVLGFPADDTLPVAYAVSMPTRTKKNKAPELFVEKSCWKVVPGEHSMACGLEGRLFAAVQADTLFVKDFESKIVQFHRGGSRKFTSVAVHPYEWICATGDDTGRIVLWENFMERSHAVTKTVLHWHTLPVADLAFSVEGTHIYSGGGECTLVKWNIDDRLDKRTIPRMGLPIRHLSRPTANFIAVSHADNSIQLVNMHNIVGQCIHNLTQCYIPLTPSDEYLTKMTLGKPSVFQTGLHLDPNNGCLVMNGKPGSLQCYSFREDKHMYSLDITQQNYITAERNHAVPNADVTHVSFSKNGTWLATGESRVDESRCTELRLKFWKFDKQKQMFVLNTSIDWPHDQETKCLKIQPINDTDISLLAATSGDDRKFKTWGIVFDSSIHGKSQWWNCENVGSYRDMSAGPLAFSEDGSLLAAAFERVLTLWSCDDHFMRLSLCHVRIEDHIRLVEFGSHLNSHLIVACTSQNLAVWDVITASLLWAVPFQTECLSIDPYSNLAAAFSTDHRLFFFRLDSSIPLAIHDSVSASKVVSSVFISNSQQYEKTNLKSTLLFINTSQELCAMVVPESEKESDIAPLELKPHMSALTPFAQMMAEKRVTEEASTDALSTGAVGKLTYQTIREIMEVSPHTMPSIDFFSKKLLHSLTSRRGRSGDLKEMEDFQLSQAQANPDIKKSLSVSTNTRRKVDETAYDFGDLDNFIIPSTDAIAEEKILSSPAQVDLNAVANDDTTWIQSIYNLNITNADD